MQKETKGRFALIGLLAFFWAGWSYKEQTRSLEICSKPMQPCNCTKTNKEPQHKSDSDEKRLVNQMTKNNSALFFFYNPQKFVREFADCLVDKKCHVYYHHAKKTGGSTLGYVLSHVVGYEKFNSDDWCCGNFLQRFSAYPKQMCDLPFVPAEIKGAQFQAMVQTCMTKYNTGRRAIILTSIREPIQRTVSMINQKCNKNCREGKCSRSLTTACQRCQHKADKAVWDGFVRDTNTMYNEIQRIHENKVPNVQLLSIDTWDIAYFFEQLSRFASIENTNVVRNPEKVEFCDYAMTSALFRNLAPSHAIYRNISMGLQR